MNSINQETHIMHAKAVDNIQMPLLPNDVLKIIFDELTLEKVVSCSVVCKIWKRLVKTCLKTKIFQEYACSPMLWNEIFGKGAVTHEEILKAYRLLPDNIVKILKSPCEIFPGKKIIETHMLVWIPDTIKGKLLTLKSFGELIKQKEEFSKNPLGYRRIWSSIVLQKGGKSFNSGWVLMTTEIIPETLNKSYEAQSTLVKSLKGCYEVPKIAEVVVCIVAYYFKTKTRLFSDGQLNYVRCQEYVNDKCETNYVTIGNFKNSGFLVGRITLSNKHSIPDHTGVAALHRLTQLT